MSRRGSGGGFRGRGRGRGSRRSDSSSVEDQRTCRRKLTDKCQLKLCDFTPKCTNGEACPRAHNEEELQLWQSTLRETVREFPKDGGILKICRNAADGCMKGLKCNHAHSPEELKRWSEAIECRSSSGKVLEMCKNKDKDCSFGEDCRYAHNYKELKSWIQDHESNYLESPKSKPEMCTFTVNPPPCKLGVTCPYAHSKAERDKLIQTLIDYDRSQPRPVPRKGKLLPYTLCKNEGIDRKNVDGKCIYGVVCPQAHSVEELQYWEQQRREGAASLPGPLEHRTGCDALLGSPEDPAEPLKVDSSDGDRSSDIVIVDPFLVSLEDFQHQFGHQLSIAFNLFILAAKKDLPSELGGYITHDRTKIDISTSEGQEDASMFDLQYQLGFMQRNATTLAAYVEIDGLAFSDVTLNLLEVRNSLAHGLNKRDSYGEQCELTTKYFRTAIALVEKIKAKIESEKLDNCLSKLSRLECHMSEFLQYEARKEAEEKILYKMSHQQKAERAKETLAHLTALLEEELKHGGKSEVTNFVASCLAPRLRKMATLS